MGLLVFAVLVLIIYLFYTQSVKRKKTIKIIDNYIFDNQDTILRLKNIGDIEIPKLEGYSIYSYQYNRDVLNPLIKGEEEPITLDRVQYCSNVNYIDIRQGKISGDRIFFFTNKGYQHIYVFKEFLDNWCLVFVTKQASIDDYLNAKFKRY